MHVKVLFLLWFWELKRDKKKEKREKKVKKEVKINRIKLIDWKKIAAYQHVLFV